MKSTGRRVIREKWWTEEERGKWGKKKKKHIRYTASLLLFTYATLTIITTKWSFTATVSDLLSNVCLVSCANENVRASPLRTLLSCHTKIAFNCQHACTHANTSIYWNSGMQTENPSHSERPIRHWINPATPILWQKSFFINSNNSTI